MRLCVAATVLGACALSGCGLVESFLDPTPNREDVAVAWRAPTVDGHQIRRVVVLPFQNLCDHPEQVSIVESAFVDEFQKRQAVEVVSLDRGALTESEEEAFLINGRVQADTLVRLSRHHQADAVLYGAVTQYKGYEPLALGLRVELVSAGAGDVVWSANGIFDAADDRVQRDVRNFHDTTLGETHSLEGWRLVLMSPNRFATYACARVVETY